MNVRLLLVSLAGALLSWGGSRCAAADPPPWQAGVAKVDITPEEPLRLSGYGNRSEVSQGVEQRLFARALVIRRGDTTLALVSADIIGWPATLVEEAIAPRVAQECGIPRACLALCATHTHTAPQLHGGLTNIFRTPLSEEQAAATRRYTEQLAGRVVESVRLALRDLAPARLLLGEGRAEFAVNRRLVENGRYRGFGVNRQGPVDHRLPVLAVYGADDQLRGVVFNYACHCTTLGPDFNRVCGDWAGYAAGQLESAFPKAVALCTIGCGADANPEPRGQLSMAIAHGRETAAAVRGVLQQPEVLRSITEGAVASFGTAALPYALPSVEQLRARVDSGDVQTARHAQYWLQYHAQQGKLPDHYPAPVQVWRFGGQLTMVFLGGEVVVDYALRLRRELAELQASGGPYVWTTAYANDVFGYVASERVRREGGYEVDRSGIYYNLPGPWAENTEEVLIGRVHQLVRQAADAARGQR